MTRGMGVEIHVRLGEPLWRAVGQRRLTLIWPDGVAVTVDAVIARLAEEYESFGPAYAGEALRRPHPYRVFVDSILVDSPALAALGSEAAGAVPQPLHHGQTVFILLPATGG